MRFSFFILTILSFAAGVLILSAAKSAVHEIEAFILFLISAVLATGLGIIDAIGSAKRELLSSIQANSNKRGDDPAKLTRDDFS